MYRIVIAVCICVGLAVGLDNGVARTPPMGWLAWERFRCVTDCETFPNDCIGEKLFMDMADKLASDGWKEVGYQFVNIDDCWMSKERDSNGKLVADPKRFPHGMKYLADYVHSKGLKLGIYEDYGKLTCGGYPGSQGYEVIDANTFAEWGVDMLKFDGCYSNDTSKEIGYPLMSSALNKTGRPIVFDCSWPAYEGGLPPKVNYTQLGEICNLWRNYGDIQDSWDSVTNIIDWWGKNQDVLIPAAGPGRWNDPDMLIVGDFSLSLTQSKSQFGMWAMLAAPLFMSNDLRSISPGAVEILQNRDVIAVSQDPLGKQGHRYVNSNSIQIWSRPLVNKASAIAILSTRTDGDPHQVIFTLRQLGITTTSTLLDLFTKKTSGKISPDMQIEVYVDPSGIIMYKAIPVEFEIFEEIDIDITF